MPCTSLLFPVKNETLEEGEKNFQCSFRVLNCGQSVGESETRQELIEANEVVGL